MCDIAAVLRHVLPLLACLVPALAHARPPVSVTHPSSFCEAAITAAETMERLPARLIDAIAMTESGRMDAATGRVRPWPWTINAEGAGQFFASKAEAVAAVQALQARGVRSIDVGCMQVNLMHHPNAFRSLDEAFDPHANARYGARFLASLHAAHGAWPAAVGAYHSATPVLGNAYRDIVLARWQRPNLAGGPSDTSPYRAFAGSVRAYGTARAYGAFAGPAQSYAAFTTRN